MRYLNAVANSIRQVSNVYPENIITQTSVTLSIKGECAARRKIAPWLNWMFMCRKKTKQNARIRRTSGREERPPTAVSVSVVWYLCRSWDLFKNKDPRGPESSCMGTVGASYVGVGYWCCVRALWIPFRLTSRRGDPQCNTQKQLVFVFWGVRPRGSDPVFGRRRERLRQRVAIWCELVWKRDGLQLDKTSDSVCFCNSWVWKQTWNLSYFYSVPWLRSPAASFHAWRNIYDQWT